MHSFKFKKHGFKFKITSGAFLVSAVMLFAIPAQRLINMGAAVGVHEAGHIIAIICTGGKIEALTVSIGGLVIKTDGKMLSPVRSVIVSLSGIAANFICFAVCAFFGIFHDFRLFCILFAVLNSIPAYGFDTYCAVECFIFEKQALLSALSGVSLFILWVFSVYILLVYPSNPSLFALCVSVYLTTIGKNFPKNEFDSERF